MAYTSPNMGLRVWNLSTDPYDHDQLADNLARIDFHDHSPGRGHPIPTEAFNDQAITSAKLSNAATVKAVGSFSAYRSAALSLADVGIVVYDAEDWDFSGWHDVGTGRYTPQVAGYYRLSANVQLNAALTADNYVGLLLYKNGSLIRRGPRFYQRSTPTVGGHGTWNVVANGTTDFFDIRLSHNNGGSIALATGSTETYFQGHILGRS